jgi:hypothetical protein
VTIAAIVPDLMDRSRLTSAIDQPVTFARSVGELSGDEAVVIVDVARGVDLGELRRAVPRGRIIAFGPHVDDDALAAAQAAGIDVVLPRSQFFRRAGALLG